MDKAKPGYAVAVGFVIPLIVIIVVLVLIVVGRHRPVKPNTEQDAVTASTLVVAQPPEPGPPQLKLLDKDPEYTRLRKMSSYDLIDSLPAYQDAVEKRNNLIKAKVGNISDPSLYRTLANEVSQGIPEISRQEYQAAAEAELQKQKQIYVEIHKDDYFMVGTYENYYPKAQKVVFNLRKAGISEDAKDFSSVNFGTSLPEPPKDYPLEDSGKYGISSLGESWDSVDGDPMVINYDRWKPDWLEECHGYPKDCSGALVVSVVPEKMDAAYAAVARLMGTQIEKLYADEMAAGGYHAHVTPNDEGTFWTCPHF